MDLSFSDLVFRILAAYAVSFVLVESHLLEPIREWFINLMRNNPYFVCWKTTDIDPRDMHPEFDEDGCEVSEMEWSFFTCRMCVGFWVSLAIILFFGGGVLELLAIYGGSYFLATQER